MEWLTEEEVEAVEGIERSERRRVVARRIGAALFVVVFLLDVLAPQLELASRLCAL